MLFIHLLLIVEVNFLKCFELIFIHVTPLSKNTYTEENIGHELKPSSSESLSSSAYGLWAAAANLGL